MKSLKPVPGIDKVQRTYVLSLSVPSPFTRRGLRGRRWAGQPLGIQIWRAVAYLEKVIKG